MAPRDLTKSPASLLHRRSLVALGINLGLAVLSGVLFAVAFPNYAIGWLIFIAPIPLFIVLARATHARDAFLLGWISQFTAWLIMVPWVVRVMSHYGGLPYITGVLAFIALCTVLCGGQTAVDMALNPLTFVGGAPATYAGVATGSANVVDTRSQHLHDLDELERNSLDYYATLRSVYRQHREHRLQQHDLRPGKYECRDQSGFDVNGNTGEE